MPHIHTEPGQIDFIAEVFIVYKDKVLIRLHEKHGIWIAPGGHIELHETPEEAALREAKEETGLDIELYLGNSLTAPVGDGWLHPLIPPMFMNVHPIPNSENHRHISMVYFATAQTDQITQPESAEKTECRWMTKEEIVKADDMDAIIKGYALQALDTLAH